MKTDASSSSGSDRGHGTRTGYGACMSRRLVLVFALLGACAHRPAPEVGQASWYGRDFRGKPTASGEPFRPSRLTAAHRTHAFGTVLRVTRTDTGQRVRVVVNDRGPFVAGRIRRPRPWCRPADRPRGRRGHRGRAQGGRLPKALRLRGLSRLTSPRRRSRSSRRGWGRTPPGTAHPPRGPTGSTPPRRPSRPRG